VGPREEGREGGRKGGRGGGIPSLSVLFKCGCIVGGGRIGWFGLLEVLVLVWWDWVFGGWLGSGRVVPDWSGGEVGWILRVRDGILAGVMVYYTSASLSLVVGE